jgi:WD40 repeat protein
LQQVSQTDLEKFTAFVNDTSAFVRYFGIAMAKSAPHVYLSTLPFAPTCSLVSMHYLSMFPRTLHVKSGQLSHWPSSEMVISTGSLVNSIALSSDGQCIVSGLDDGTICVWNAMTGETVAGPFSGHSSWVTSVAFSPDGQHIVSGSYDKTIRVWNIMTGGTEMTASGQVDFTNQSKINDEGWICGSNNELLMWIPPLHRTGLQRPGNIWVSSEHETCLDLSTFVHGHSWSTCINT